MDIFIGIGRVCMEKNDTFVVKQAYQSNRLILLLLQYLRDLFETREIGVQMVPQNSKKSCKVVLQLSYKMFRLGLFDDTSIIFFNTDSTYSNEDVHRKSLRFSMIFKYVVNGLSIHMLCTASLRSFKKSSLPSQFEYNQSRSQSCTNQPIKIHRTCDVYYNNY